MNIQTTARLDTENKGKTSDSKSKTDKYRSIAKIGMALSMGTLVYTGFRGKESAAAHITAGLALVGFSFWHYRLYQPSSRNKR